MRILILCLVIIAAVAEPPVNNRYLPPGQGNSRFGKPLQTYGAPGSGFGTQRQTDAVFRGRPSSNYGAPSYRPSNQYIPPNPQFGSRTPSSQYLAPSIENSRIPSSQYGAPSFGQNQAPSSQYGAPGNGQRRLSPSTQYGAPGLQGPTQYALRQQEPSEQYGAPGFGGDQYSQNGFQAEQSRAYLPPGGRRGGYGGDDDGSNGEPANYSFEYMVKNEPSDNDFGHRESRQGDRAQGLYYVLLPDGRKQTVEYEADQDGYKPRISYEDTGLGQNGYGGNGQNGYQNSFGSVSGPY